MPKPHKASYRRKFNARPTDLQLAYQVARLKVEEGLSQEAIAEELDLSRGTVQKLWVIAQEQNIYIEGVIPPVGVDFLVDLRKKVIQRLGLKGVRLVPGRSAMLDGTLPANAREVILHSAAAAAAEYLGKHVMNGDILCLAWGRVVHAIIRLLNIKHPRPNLTIVPMLGVMSVQPHWFEANALVEAAAAAYQTNHYYCLPIPAVVRNAAQKRVAMQLPLVTPVLQQVRRASFVVTSLAPPDPQESTLVRYGMLDRSDIQRVIQCGAIGEICAWWFDPEGHPVPDHNIEPIGLGLDGLRHVVEGNGTVMAMVAADRQRIAPLLAAIKGRLVNVVVTDHVTAEELLRRA
ncbi:MAG: hypothetical protein HY320_03785 [Armatimonadetes bacterium]|nr:hypothetical protein [Armatimonadota bacterium]